VQRDIKKLCGGFLDVKPSKVDITQMRKLLHTPKDGLIIPESLDFYKELLDENQYLRKFINGFD
jgi:hypothetical protein